LPVKVNNSLLPCRYQAAPALLVVLRLKTALRLISRSIAVNLIPIEDKPADTGAAAIMPPAKRPGEAAKDFSNAILNDNRLKSCRRFIKKQRAGYRRHGPAAAAPGKQFTRG